MTAQIVEPLTGAELHATYTEIQQFYAKSFHLLDDGRAAEWAETFTADGTFSVPTLDTPVQGRAALRGAVERTHAELARIGQRHRHWHGMIAVEPRPDGAYDVRCYAQVIASTIGGDSRLHRACVCQDVIVREDDGVLRVRSRFVTRDDLP